MNRHTVITVPNYDRIDGKNAYQSHVKQLSLGAPMQAENQSMPIAAQLWKQNGAGALELCTELPLHQVFDLMILLSRAMLHFRDAYRLPLLYDPARPVLDRIGLQGDAMQIAVCTENPSLNADMEAFSLALGSLGELTGERLRTLARLLSELECF